MGIEGSQMQQVGFDELFLRLIRMMFESKIISGIIIAGVTVLILRYCYRIYQRKRQFRKNIEGFYDEINKLEE